MKARPDPEIKTFIGKAREISGVNIDPKSSSRRNCSQSSRYGHCCCNGHQLPTLQIEYCSVLILLDPNTFAQGWRNGQRSMKSSLSLVLTWLRRQPMDFLW
ncbi:hypothetical protein V2J09_005745 [Rumex salicifolius]